jgi:pimeloyl-ACP methyl ester carboxylesterase
LGYAEYGNPKGKPVFYFHGFPSSRLEAALLHKPARHFNIRIISVDRPGMGLSTFQQGRHILDFVNDIDELADTLDIDRFAIMGMSGGGPYVSACAYKIPERITSASIISGVGPIDVSGAKYKMILSTRLCLWLSLRVPWLMRVLFVIAVNRVRRNHNLFFGESLPEADRRVLSSPITSDILIESMLEAFNSGTIGPVWDARLLAKPWGFNPEEIKIPVQLWHGELDRNAPPVIARRLADRIPNCQAKFISYEGHFSLWLNHIEEIIDNLVSQSYLVPLNA